MKETVMTRLFIVIVFVFGFVFQAWAQGAQPETEPNRSATGGAQTLEDILARQRGEKVEDDFRRSATGDPNSAAAISSELGTLGGASDAELWRALRYGSADITVSSGGLPATVLMQDGGMQWLEFRKGPLATYGGYLLLGMIVLLVLFFLIRGRIRIEGKKTGRTITRFKAIERFGHWLLAGSFIVLGITGLLTLFGRIGLISLFGRETYATIALASKWLHNNVAWAFILGLIMILVMWIIHNLPDRTDMNWLLKAGGLFSKHSHPPAKKFNAGQKLIFWSVIILGGSISLTGLSLLFPFELPMFAKTFAMLNVTGLPELFGYGMLPEQMAPHEEMQYAQLWHAMVSFVLIAIIIAHIYIGSIGMEGAYDAMGSGEVEEQWAREHHSLWVEEEKSARKAKRKADTKPAPAE